MRRNPRRHGRKACLAIVFAGVLALGGIPIGALGSPAPRDPGPTEPGVGSERPGGPWNVSTSVHAWIVDNYVRVNVTHTIENPGPAIEFPFEVRVPRDAFISGLVIERGGERYEAEVELRQDAQQAYRDARSQGRTAGLVEQQRDANVYAFDVNVGTGQTVNATLTYETYLTATKGVYELPLVAPPVERGQDEGVRFRVEIQHRGGLDRVWGTPQAKVDPTPEGLALERIVEERDGDEPTRFVAHYTLEETPRWGEIVTTIEDGTGYFVHRFRAAPGSAQLPLDMVLVLDTSGSMTGAKIDQLRDAAKQLVGVLSVEDRLHLAAFASGIRQPWKGLATIEEEKRQLAFDAISGLLADGSTNMEAGIRAGFGSFPIPENGSAERMPVLVFLTDGHPTTGMTSTDQLRGLARAENDVGAHVFGLSFGAGADRELVQGLAEDGNGTAVHVAAGQGARADIQRFLTALTTPVLKHVRIAYNDSVHPVDRSAQALFAGSEMLVVGRFDPGLEHVNATVRAEARDGAHAWNVSEPVEEDGPSYLPRLVAYQRIRALEAKRAASGPDPEIEREIEQLALEHGFVTEETSLVLALPSRTPNATDGPTVNASTNASLPNGTLPNGTLPNGTLPNGSVANGTLPNASAPNTSFGNGTKAGAPALADRDGDGVPDAQDPEPASAGGSLRIGSSGATQTGPQDAHEASRGPQQGAATGAGGGGSPGSASGGAPAPDPSHQGQRSADRRDALSRQLDGTQQEQTPGPGAATALAALASLALFVRRRRG